jgi:hypothetical protein
MAHAMSEKVWFPSRDACWSLGHLRAIDGGKATVLDVDTGIANVVKASDTHACDPSHLEDLDDVSLLNNLHEAPLLHLLKRRYALDKIYSWTGEILISIVSSAPTSHPTSQQATPRKIKSAGILRVYACVRVTAALLGTEYCLHTYDATPTEVKAS